MAGSPPRTTPLSEKSSNIKGGIRMVQPETTRLPDRDDFFSRTPLPTHPSHILLPPSKVPSGFQSPRSTGSHTSTAATHNAPQSQPSGTVSPILKPKLPQKQRLQIHKDTKTFSLVPSQSTEATEDSDPYPQSPRPTLSNKSSYTSLHSSYRTNAELKTNSISSCNPSLSSIGPAEPSTPAPESKIISESLSNSPWNYEFVGGLRKVKKTPNLRKIASKSELPPLPEAEASHNLLSEKPSFQSINTTDTAPSTLSGNTNYRIFYNSPSPSELALAPPSSSDSNYQLLGDPSPAASSVILYRPKTAISESSNYQLHGDASPSESYLELPHESKYSQESLLVPPLQPKARRSDESLAYYRSKSLRTGSLTSISTVLSQQAAAQAIAGIGSLVTINPKIKAKSDLWAVSPDPLSVLSYHMNDSLANHQWSSQLSTVHSVSDIGSDRGSRTWSDNYGRRSSGLPSTPSRHSRRMLSISSSLAQEEAASRSDSIEPPQPAFARNGQRHLSNSSIRMVEDLDEYGDGITDMQDLRTRPSRTRLSGFFSVTSSDNGRTNTMRSSGSSRANSLLSSTIPTWARLYYGSGERRYLGAPGSSTEGTESRANSFRTGSPNTDHFPLNLYSPRRRPREINTYAGPSGRGSLEITPAPQLGSDGQLINDPYSRRFRTWSMSSIWSPHLRRDRRATRHSVWEPPSVNWSTEGGWFGRRNVQIVMFIAGFIFPLSWMIAALLPLPMNPMLEMRERDNSASNLDGSNDISNDYIRQFGPMDEARYESAKWWRGLNRWMSLVGILIVAVVVILVVLSIRKGW